MGVGDLGDEKVWDESKLCLFRLVPLFGNASKWLAEIPKLVAAAEFNPQPF